MLLLVVLAAIRSCTPLPEEPNYIVRTSRSVDAVAKCLQENDHAEIKPLNYGIKVAIVSNGRREAMATYTIIPQDTGSFIQVRRILLGTLFSGLNACAPAMPPGTSESMTVRTSPSSR